MRNDSLTADGESEQRQKLHLTEQLRGLFSVLSLQGLRQKRVEAGVRFLLPGLFILHLVTSQNTTLLLQEVIFIRLQDFPISYLNYH